MKNLYIDFDGVILDTITPVYNLAKKLLNNLTASTLGIPLSYTSPAINTTSTSFKIIISIILSNIYL